MSVKTGWTRQQLLVAFNLYCQLPFGKLHSRNLDIIKYAELIGRTPSALAMKLSNIASIDPAITSSGRKGLTGASSADRAMWNEMQTNWEQFAFESYEAMKGARVENEENIEANNKSPTDEIIDYAGSNKTVQTKVRVGQGLFRKAVLSAYDYRCCITGLAVPKLLVASHIVPWRDDKANRLNPRNGLCLSILHDKAFDIGIITISKEMTVRVSQEKVAKNDVFFSLALIKYENKPIMLPEKFQPDADFLSYHRKYIFNQ